MKNLIKTTLSLILIFVLCACPLMADAASDMVTADYSASCDWLITVKNPEAATSVTTAKTFVVSAVALEGTIVTLYNLNPETNLYEKIYVDGVALETVVGASGLYAQQITLKEGVNNIMVYATNGVNEQVTKLSIELISEGLIDKIKAFAIDFTNIF